jgi:hypothetical protein
VYQDQSLVNNLARFSANVTLVWPPFFLSRVQPLRESSLSVRLCGRALLRTVVVDRADADTTAGETGSDITANESRDEKR